MIRSCIEFFFLPDLIYWLTKLKFSSNQWNTHFCHSSTLWFKDAFIIRIAWWPSCFAYKIWETEHIQFKVLTHRQWDKLVYFFNRNLSSKNSLLRWTAFFSDRYSVYATVFNKLKLSLVP